MPPAIASIRPWGADMAHPTHEIVIDQPTLDTILSYLDTFGVTDEHISNVCTAAEPEQRRRDFALTIAHSAALPGITPYLQNWIECDKLPPSLAAMMRHLATENPHPGVHICPLDAPPEYPYRQIPQAWGWLAWLV